MLDLCSVNWVVSITVYAKLCTKAQLDNGNWKAITILDILRIFLKKLVYTYINVKFVVKL